MTDICRGKSTIRSISNHKQNNNHMKRIILSLLMMAEMMTFGLQAQQVDFSVRYLDNAEIDKMLNEAPATDLSQRKSRRQVLPTLKYLMRNEARIWTSGTTAFATLYDSDTRIVEQMQYGVGAADKPRPSGLGELKVVSGKVTVVGKKGNKVTVEKFGRYTMLVERTSAGVPVNSFYEITLDELNKQLWALPICAVLNGNYAFGDKAHVVFGPKKEHYVGDRYDTDPGYYSFRLGDDMKSVNIEYGEGRMSHGDPSSSNYGKMPGGGGAGALMGPMVWNVRPTVDGLFVKILEDQRFVSHNPSIDKESNLVKEQCVYEGLDGKWAFASVMPLTPAILNLFPREVLVMMRSEIYARQGAKFTDAAVQSYFDKQPWYKKSGKAAVLTDIERFNVALIKQVEKNK